MIPTHPRESLSNPDCPQCGKPLSKVEYPENSMLNQYQFDAVRAGDWFCVHCKGTEAKSGWKYWWNKDINDSADKIPPSAVPRESLYVIEDSLQQLADTRAAAEADGDTEALKVIDQLEFNYLLQRGEKIDSYAGLIHKREDTADLCEKEAARLLDRAKAARNDVARLKQTALTVMQQFDVKELSTPTNTIRRQKNGGLQPLEIALNAAGVPDEYLRVTVSLPLVQWRAMAAAFEDDPGMARVHEQLTKYPETERIREALKQRVKCPECNGLGASHNNSAASPCPRCGREGTIPQTIPGTKLLERGEHVRVL